jgi:hypothetical protein
VKFTNEPTAVDARFQPDGTVHPRRFTRSAVWLDVTDVGRQWEDPAGRHVLVMVGGRHAFELLLEREGLTWHIVRAPDDVGIA